MAEVHRGGDWTWRYDDEDNEDNDDDDEAQINSVLSNVGVISLPLQ
jgi:hypothetical protein